MMQELYTFKTTDYNHRPLRKKLKREEMESLLELIIRNEEERKKFLDSRKGKNAVEIIEEAAEKHGIVDTEIYEKAFRKTVIEYFVQDNTNPFFSEKELLPRWREIHKKYKSLSVKSRRDIWSRKKEEFLEKGIKTSGDYLRALFSHYIYYNTVRSLASIKASSFRTGLDLATEKVLSNGEVPLQIVKDLLTKGGSKVLTLYHIKELKEGYYDKLSGEARNELNKWEEWHDNFDKFVDALKKSEESEIYALEVISRLKKIERINKEETEELNNKNKIKTLKTAIMKELNEEYNHYLKNSREMNAEEKNLYEQIIKEIKSTQINKKEFEKIINRNKNWFFQVFFNDRIKF